MSKIKILVAVGDKAGVGYHRLIAPHKKIQELFPEEFEIEIKFEGSFDWKDDNFLKNYQIIAFNRSIHTADENNVQLLDRLTKLGIISVMDVDDYWNLPPEHPIHQIAVSDDLARTVTNSARMSDYVTTTTPHFASVIKELNENVHVIPNGVEPTEEQFTPKPIESSKTRFLLLGGSSHLHDWKHLQHMFAHLHHHYPTKVQAVLAGFDIRGTFTDILPDGTKRQRKMRPEESVWIQYERIVTNNYNAIKDKEYLKHLFKFKKEIYNNELEQPYVRRWTENLPSYGKNYNYADISLAPLAHHEFNRCKSQLKVIEAGFHKKPIIAENLEPYKIDIIDGKNGFLVDSLKDNEGWFKISKKFVENPSMIEDYGEALYETVKDKYSLSKVATDRAELYKSII